MTRELPIGVFDSGIGGLTVVRELRKVLPSEDIVYLGDTARVPYGTKSPGTVVRFAQEDTRFLVQQNVKAVVVACNTCSAWALPVLEKKFNLPVFGVILPGVRAALDKSRAHRIGIIGTSATIRSKAYANAILARSDSAQVFARACPLLVPLVEEGWTRHPVTATVLREYLQPLLARRIDTLILGCTHYPLLAREISQVLGPEVKLVDSAHETALEVRALLQRNKALRPIIEKPEHQFYASDSPMRFKEVGGRFLGGQMLDVQKVVVEGLKLTRTLAS